MENKIVSITGTTLEACLKRAEELLGLKKADISYEVVQYGSGSPDSGSDFILKAWKKAEAPPEAGEGHLGRMFENLNNTLLEMKKELASFDNQDSLGIQGALFEEMLSDYDNLDKEMQDEIEALKNIGTEETKAEINRKTARDGNFKIVVSEDGMSVRLNVNPPKGTGRAVTLAMVEALLKKKGIRFGIDVKRIEQTLVESDLAKREASNVVIAQGRNPVLEEKEYVEYLFLEQVRERTSAEGGTDRIGTTQVFKVYSGQVLARIRPASESSKGKNVFGKIIEPDIMSAVALVPGKNVVFDKGTGEFKSLIDGSVEVKNDIISVRNMYFIDSDVDMNVGNVKFDGAIHIHGCVRDGFSVEATDDIVIKGTVEGASVISEKGSITIYGGIAGKNRCYVSAGEDVKAGYIEHGIVYAGRKVEVGSAILHSKVIAGTEIIVSSGKGVISGGHLLAGEAIIAKTLGAPSEPYTQLVIGLDRKTQLAIRTLEESIYKVRQIKLKVKTAMDKIIKQISDLPQIPESVRAEITEQKKMILVIEYREKKIQKEADECERRALAHGRCRLIAYKGIYRKVYVKMGQEKFFPKSEQKWASYEWDPDEKKLHKNRGVSI